MRTRSSFALIPLSLLLVLAGCGGGAKVGGGPSTPSGGSGPTVGAIRVQLDDGVPQTPAGAVAAAPGQRVTFSVTASGEELTFRWTKDGAAIGASVPALQIGSASSADAGAYAVSVSDAKGRTAAAAAVRLVVDAVAVPPTIDAQPTAQSVSEGQRATFSVLASSPTPLGYQWQRNGAAISGADGASYTTPATTVAGDDGARYRVLVTNAAATVTSAEVTLTVNPVSLGQAPTITTAPANQTVNAGQAATFTVAATGTAPLAYQWQKNGVDVTGATSATYTTPAASAADSGAVFTVTVSNAAGAVSRSATLTVRSAPAITVQPASRTVTEGETATFSVVASGTGPMTYQWRRNGAAISGATAASYTTPATTVAGDNGARFQVVVTNAVGSATSTPATLTVNASGGGGDTAQYNFEAGTQSWGAAKATVAVSTAQAYAGTHSLAVTFTGETDPSVFIDLPRVAPSPGAKVVFHLYVPAGAKIDALQAYVQPWKQADASNWQWLADYKHGAELKAGAWNTFTISIPTGAAPDVHGMGFQFSLSSGGWPGGTVYLDSVGWVCRTSCPAGLDCGTVLDGCGGTLTCGTGCPAGETCGGGGEANVCAADPLDGLVPLDPPDASQGWLSTSGNHLYRNSAVWVGRGANVPDTRRCWGVNYPTQEWITAAQASAMHDAVTDQYQACDGTTKAGWGADFLRLALSTGSYPNVATDDTGDFLYDAEYRAHVVALVDNLARKRVNGRPVYVLVSLWSDRAMPENQVPTTAATGPAAGSAVTMEKLWVALSTVFYKYPYVLYGLTNEPHGLSSGDYPEAWTRFNDVVKAIRANEDAMAARLGQATPNRHVIAVQGLNNYARDTSYYLDDNPITAGGGKNVVYEIHPYVHQADFKQIITTPARALPLVIGEFGPDPKNADDPYSPYMLPADLQPMMTLAESLQVPYLGWFFQTDCNPGMLSSFEFGTSGSKVCLDIAASDWGNTLKQQLAKPSP